MEDGSLFRMLVQDMRAVASYKLFNRASTVDDIMAAKLMFYTIDVMEMKIEAMAHENPIGARVIGRK